MPDIPEASVPEPVRGAAPPPPPPASRAGGSCRPVAPGPRPRSVSSEAGFGQAFRRSESTVSSMTKEARRKPLPLEEMIPLPVVTARVGIDLGHLTR